MISLKKLLSNIIKPQDTIETRTQITENNFCPPHYTPHKLPDGNPITDEPCHFHTSRIHQYLHHIPFCLTKCPHYRTMLKARKKYLSKR